MGTKIAERTIGTLCCLRYLTNFGYPIGPQSAVHLQEIPAFARSWTAESNFLVMGLRRYPSSYLEKLLCVYDLEKFIRPPSDLAIWQVLTQINFTICATKAFHGILSPRNMMSEVLVVRNSRMEVIE